MAHKNPVVLSTDGKKHETLGDGDTLAPGSIPISAESGNSLSVKSDGLFAETGGGGGGGLTEVAHDKSLAGKGTTADPLKFTIVGSAGAADSDNILRVDAVQDGTHNLRVPHVADVVKETPSITAQVGDDGSGGRKTIMDVRLSGRDGNALQILDFGADGGAGLFAAMGGGGMPGFGAPIIIPEETELGIIEAKYYDLLMDTSITEGVMYHYPAISVGGEPVENAGNGILLFAVPAGDGVIAAYSGVAPATNKQGLRVRYHDDTNTVLLVENMQEHTPLTDETLMGWGDISSELAVQVSTDPQNELTVLRAENSDNPGLYSRPISAMLFASDDSIEKTSNYEGNPKNAGIKVRLSSRANNNLKLVPLSESSTERGLFASKMTRGTGGGNWSFGYPDSPGAKNACGKMGSGIYFKSTIDLNNANVGDVNVKVDVWIKNLPCMEDGTLVSHRVIVDYVSSTTSAKPTVAIWLICDTPPTHMINIESKTITKLQRSPESPTTGLPDYPTAPDGEFAQEFTYSRQYFYMA